jgi:hypothetical protein
LNSSERLGGTGGQTVTMRAISARCEFMVQVVGAKDTSPVTRVKRASYVLHILTINLAWSQSLCGNLNQSIYGSLCTVFSHYKLYPGEIFEITDRSFSWQREST